MPNNRKISWLKILKRIALGILLFLLISLILLRIPLVQTYLASQATSYLSNKIGSEVNIEKVAINFVDNICLKGIYVEDDKADTLLFSENIVVDLAFFKLFRNIIEIDDIEMENPTIRINQYDEDRFNFTSIEHAFQSNEEEADSASKSSLTFDLNTISISKPDIKINLLETSASMKASNIYLNMDVFNLDELVFEFDEISAKEFEAVLINLPTNTVDSILIDESTITTIEEIFPLEELPVEIKINKLSFENSSLFITDKGATNTDSFSSAYLNLQELQFLARNIKVNQEELEIDLKNFHSTINDQFTLNSIKAEVNFTNEQLLVKGFDLKTPYSTAAFNADINYNSYADLLDQKPSVKIDFDLSTFDLLLSELEYFFPDLRKQEEFLYVRDKHLTSKTSIQGDLSNLKINSLETALGDSYIKSNGIILYPFNQNKLFFNSLELHATANYDDYAFFIQDSTTKIQLEQLGNITLDSYITGDLADMNFEKLKFNSDALLQAEFSGNIKSLNNTENLSFNLDIKEIRSGKSDLAIFIDSLPSVFDEFDTLVYTGNLVGNLHSFDLDGGFETSLGHLDTNGDIDFNTSYEDAIYKGYLNLEDFELGKMIDNDSLGNITMKIDFSGSGISSTTLDTKVEGVIKEVEYNSYNYKEIQVNGLIKPSLFSGLIKMDDKNARLNFEGFVDMNDSIPQVDFNLEVDTIDLNALNLYDDQLALHFNMDAKFQGFDIDEILGSIKVDSIGLTGETNSWNSDSLLFEASSIEGERGLFLSSEFLNGSVTGNYTVAKLPETILDFMDQYFPLKRFLGSSPKEDAILTSTEKQQIKGEKINIALGWENMEELLQVFDIPVNRMDSSYFVFNLNAPDNLTDLEFHIPFLNYDGFGLDSIYAKGNNTENEKIDLLFRIDSVIINPETHIADIQSNFLFGEEKARTSLLVQADPGKKSLGTDIIVKSEGVNQFIVEISDDFFLNDQKWLVDQDSSITVQGSKYNIPLLSLLNKNQSLSVSGNNKDITSTFSNFKLENLTELVKMDSLAIFGLLNGDVNVELADGNKITGDLNIKDVYFNELEIGDFDIVVLKKGEEIESTILVDGESLQLSSDVGYDLQSSEFSGDIDLNKLNLEAIDPFVSEYAQNVNGLLEGNIRLNGTVEKPDVKGRFNITNASAYINSLETTYRIKDGVIDLYEDKISPVISLEDEEKRIAKLSGKITHNYFEKLILNLDFDAEEFTFLDSEKSRTSDFYGKFVGEVDAKITGPLEEPVIRATIKALSTTDATLQLLNGSKTISNENYIIFYDGNEILAENVLDSLGKALYTTEKGIEMNLDLQTDPSAQFHVIVDPITGDKLDIRGTSNIFVKIPPAGDLDIVGDFTVSDGLYRLSYENTIKRNFIIDEGSTIHFQGNPYSAGLDMRALYTTKTNTYALVNQLGSSFEDESASNRETVQVVLNVGGTLSKPELSFDIQVPENDSDPVSNSVTQALVALRQDETQLLEQVFSLILFNSFTGGSSGSNISSVGTATVVSSLGNLINGQLNKLAKNDKGFSFTIDLDQYQDASSSDGNSITEFGLDLEQKLFNDKLSINVAGNANVESGEQSQNSFSSFAGDFVIKYYITDDKNMLVKVFQASDYDALSNDSVWKTGIGLTYKKTFGKIRKRRND